LIHFYVHDIDSHHLLNYITVIVMPDTMSPTAFIEGWTRALTASIDSSDILYRPSPLEAGCIKVLPRGESDSSDILYRPPSLKASSIKVLPRGESDSSDILYRPPSLKASSIKVLPRGESERPDHLS